MVANTNLSGEDRVGTQKSGSPYTQARNKRYTFLDLISDSTDCNSFMLNKKGIRQKSLNHRIVRRRVEEHDYE